MLRNTVGGGRVQVSLKKVTKMYGLTLLALPGGGWAGVEFPAKKCYVTLERP